MRWSTSLGIASCTLAFYSGSGLALEAREIFKLAEPSVVVVLASDAKGEKNNLGSGVLIAPLDVVTSCKVLESAVDIVITQGSALRKGRLQYQDSERDLCQVHIEDPLPSSKPATRAAGANKLESGQDIFVISSPRGLERTISRTMISGLRDVPGTTEKIIQLDTQLAGASVGGGLFDQNAMLVGLLSAQIRQGNESSRGTPAEWIAQLAQRNPDRLLAPSEVTASRSGDAAQPAAAIDTRPKWMPTVGDRWKYNVIDGKRKAGTLVVEIIDAQDKLVKERITREDEKSFVAERNVDAVFSPRKTQDIVTQPGGFQLLEIAPYARGGEEPKLGQQWSDIAATPLLVWYGKHKFLMQAKVVRKETVRVPAGQFDATLLEVTANENLGSSIAKVMIRYWYAPDVKRTVKMSFHIQYSVGAVNSNPEIYELVAFEPAK